MSTIQPVENGSAWDKARGSLDSEIIDGDKGSQVLKYEAIDAFSSYYWGSKDWLKIKKEKRPGQN
mgnify:CR=1 FL=1